MSFPHLVGTKGAKINWNTYLAAFIKRVMLILAEYEFGKPELYFREWKIYYAELTT